MALIEIGSWKKNKNKNKTKNKKIKTISRELPHYHLKWRKLAPPEVDLAFKSDQISNWLMSQIWIIQYIFVFIKSQNWVNVSM